MILGRDELEFIYFISIMKTFEGKELQCYFVPIHKDLIEDWGELVGVGEPGSIEKSKEIWIDTCGEKSFFTLSVEEIFSWILSIAVKQNLISQNRNPITGNFIYSLPLVFPVSSDELKSGAWEKIT